MLLRSISIPPKISVIHQPKFSSKFYSTASRTGTAVITGASRGIGRAIALRLAQDGFDVSVSDLVSNKKELERVEGEVVKIGQRCFVSIVDVSKEDEVEGLVRASSEELGGVDVMVANAGICVLDSMLSETSLENLDKHYAVNVRGVFLCYKYAALQMIKQGRGGRIIGASSIAGKRGLATSSAYCASKFAIRGLTQSAGAELGQYGITVNAYAPGKTESPMLKSLREQGAHIADNPLGRVGTVDDIANFVSFLASSKSGFITGQSISINGGEYFD